MVAILLKPVQTICKCPLRRGTIRPRPGRCLLCLILVLSLVPAGCAKHSGQPVTLTLVGLGLQAGQHLKHDALEEFSRSSGIRVDLVPSWGTSQEQMAQTVTLLSKSSNPGHLRDRCHLDGRARGRLIGPQHVCRPGCAGACCRLVAERHRSGPARESSFLCQSRCVVLPDRPAEEVWLPEPTVVLGRIGING